jgi:hypothetical protein
VVPTGLYADTQHSTLNSVKFEDEDEDENEGRSNEWCFFGKKGEGVRAAVI